MTTSDGEFRRELAHVSTTGRLWLVREDVVELATISASLTPDSADVLSASLRLLEVDVDDMASLEILLRGGVQRAHPRCLGSP